MGRESERENAMNTKCGAAFGFGFGFAAQRQPFFSIECVGNFIWPTSCSPLRTPLSQTD